MSQIATGVKARKPRIHSRAHAGTIADIMWPPVTTVGQHDHVAAAAYLMKRAGTTALLVLDAQTSQPAGIITEADITRATTTSIRDTAKIMTTRHFRHLPVAGEAGLLGVVDIIDVCRALIGADEG